jgi:hypothetical protein
LNSWLPVCKAAGSITRATPPAQFHLESFRAPFSFMLLSLQVILFSNKSKQNVVLFLSASTQTLVSFLLSLPFLFSLSTNRYAKGYFVVFTHVITIYLSWIYPLHCSPPTPFLNQFQQISFFYFHI